MATITLERISSAEGEKRGGFNIEDTSKLSGGSGDITWLCAGCRKVLAEKMTPNHLDPNLAIRCGDCGIWHNVA